MKNKIFYLLTILISVGISSGITYIVVENKMKSIDNKEVEEKVVEEVTISEVNSISKSVDKIYDAVIYVENYTRTDKYSGTGFVYKVDDKYGYILTNHHVIEDALKVTVTNNAGETVDATILGSDEISDVAVLRIDKNSVMAVAEMGESSTCEIGDNVFTVGSPLGSKYMGTVTRGILSGKDRVVTVPLSSGNYRMEVLQTDAAINPGNSGGPLVNINGEVIGVISLKIVEDEIEGMGFAIPIEVVKTLADKLEKGEKIERPVIGVQLSDVTSTYNLYLNKIYLDSNIKSGSVVTSVDDGYPATGKLQKGDVIVELDGIKVEDTSHLRFLLYKYNKNDKITLKVIRDKKEITVELLLDKTM